MVKPAPILPGARSIRAGCLLAALVLLAQASPARTAGPHCLPPEVGEQVSELVEAGELVRGTPAGWRFRSADIDRDRLRISFTTGRQTTLAVDLLDPQADAGESSGRWFAFRTLSSGASPTRAQREALLGAARAVDEAFAQTPWIRCGAPSAHLVQPRPGGVNWVWALLGAAVGLALILLSSIERTAPLLKRPAAWIEAHPWPLLVAMLAAMAAQRLVHLSLPFDGDYATQRIFFASLDLGDILLHRYDDARHPQLFYLVLHFFLAGGHAEWIARLPAVLFSLTTAVAMFLFARPWLGAARALVAVGLLGLSAPFLFHSRDVSDVTLFLTLALASSHLLLTCLRDPSGARLAGLALAEVAMIYSYYMAVLVAAAHLVVLIVYARSLRHLRLWLVAAAAGVACVPAFIDFVRLLLDDQRIRQVAAAFPHHVWGDRAPGEFLQELADLLLPAGPAGFLFAALAAGGMVRWWRSRRLRPAGLLGLSLLVLAAGVVLIGVFSVRLKPYYLIILLPLLDVLVVAGGLGIGPGAAARAGGRLGRWLQGLALLALCLAVAAQADDLVRRQPALYEAADHAIYARLAQQVRQAGEVDTVIADPNSLHTILLYYLFPEPLKAYRGCTHRTPTGATACRYAGRRLITLTAMHAMPTMGADWEAASIAALDEAATGPSWFVYSERFENQPLLALLKRACRERGRFGHLMLFRCPPLAAGPAAPGPGADSPRAGYGQSEQGVQVEETGRQDVVDQQGDPGAAR